MRYNNRSIISILWIICLTCSLSLTGAQDNPIGGQVADYNVSEARSAEELSNFTGSNYYCDHGDCINVVNQMYLDLFGVDVQTGWYAPNQYRSVVRDWEFTNANRTLTVYLYDDLLWSDGTPITAQDVVISHELNINPDANLNREAGIANYRNIIEDVIALDDYTVEITLVGATCDSVHNVAQALKVLPAHIYHELIDEVGYAELRNHEWFQAPTVVSGAFKFGEILPDGSIVLPRNELFTANEVGYTVPESYKQIQISFTFLEDNDVSDVITELIDSGQIVYTFVSSGDVERVRAEIEAENADWVILDSTPRDAIDIMAMNQANPNNPQPAVDENGNRIEQGIHPVFGDVLVRRALAYAVDWTPVNELGHGNVITTPAHIIPQSWAYNHDLQPILHDTDKAMALLAEAGWIPENPDAPASQDNRLVCQECLYARTVDASYNGTYLQFELLYGDDQDTPNEIVPTTILQEQFEQIGITVNLMPQNFSLVLEQLRIQSFDAVLVRMNGGYPYSPESTQWFSASADNPNAPSISGALNFTSFYNEAYFALEQTALTVAGCGLSERAEIYRRMQVIMQEEMPMLFQGTSIEHYVVRTDFEGFSPKLGDKLWNLDTWYIPHDIEDKRDN